MNNTHIKYSIKDKLVFKIYVAAFFILFLQSIHVWFLWGVVFKVICPLIFVAASFFNRIKNPELYSRRQYNHIKSILLIILFISLRGSYDAGILSIGKALIGVLALYDVLLLSQCACIHFFRLITKLFGIITIISLMGWILFLIGIPLPHEYIVDKEYGYAFDNYYLFLNGPSFLFPRFCSVFLEPGYYGQLAALILFANKMKVNNIYTFTILIGVFFSLSLAGYALVSLGFIFTYMNRKYFKIYIVLAALCGCFWYGVKSYNEGDNAINLLILSRMEFEDGKMSGYNRSGEDFDHYMDTSFMQDGIFFFGLGSSFEKMTWDHGVAGYKVYLAQNGYVGLIMAILAYWYVLNRNPKAKRMMKFYFFLIMIVFWQAAYPFWFCYFSIYVTGLANLRTNNFNLL